jgi:hypothetical protein
MKSSRHAVVCGTLHAVPHASAHWHAVDAVLSSQRLLFGVGRSKQLFNAASLMAGMLGVLGSSKHISFI